MRTAADALALIRADREHIGQIRDLVSAFPSSGPRVTFDPDRIPGLDGLEKYPSIEDWLGHCESMRGKISWYLLVRLSDGRALACSVLRHRLEYDDDDPDFASHIGYSVRPDERRKGYAKEILSRTLREAERLGISPVRLVCLDSNEGSRKAILACGGQYVDTIRGDLSGLNVERYDITAGEIR